MIAVGIDMARWRLWLLKVYFNQFTNISKATLSKDVVVIPAESLTTSMQKADIDMHKAFSGKHFLGDGNICSGFGLKFLS